MLLCITLCLCGFSFGLGPLPTMLTANAFPVGDRGAVLGAVSSLAWFLSLAAVLLFEPLCTVLSVPGYFLCHSVVGAAVWLCVYLLFSE